MALFALLSLLPFMLVILFVTAVAVQRRVAIAFQILVAATALQFRINMRIAKLKLRGVMVKAACCRLPVSLGVAIRAGLSQSALVLVFPLVAAVAVLGSLFEHGAFVAVFAIGLHVLAQQRKAGLVMIELCRLFPAAFAVATSAVAPQRLLVLVVRFMAGIAIGTGLDTEKIAFVAIRALRRAMLSTQHVFGIDVMIES